MFGEAATFTTVLTEAWTFLDATMGATIIIAAGAIVGLALMLVRRGKSAAR